MYTIKKYKDEWKNRYVAAHHEWSKGEYPTAYANGFWTPPVFPKVDTSAGLTNAVIKFIIWSGYNADRTNTQGRLVDAPQKQDSGNVLTVKKYIKSANRRGTADIGATIKGRSVKIEIKVGKDKPSQYQQDEQVRERKAGGVYEFIKTMDEFINW